MNIYISLALFTIFISACSNNSSTNDTGIKQDSIATVSGDSVSGKNASIDETLTAYLHIKNALTHDNSEEAAAGAKHLHEALLKLDNASFSSDQKKVHEEMQAEMKDHAKHISDKAGKISHQREHFEMLSSDMISLVKVIKPSVTLYKDRCPMYNDKKGAEWLSETKEIKNPYYGKEMLECGEVKEEITL